MSPLLLMEWSMKPPYDWNRELSIFNSEETKSFSHLEPMEWYNQRDPEFGFGSLDLAGDGRGYDSPVSDLVNSSSSKSIKSASISLIEECKNSKITTDDFEVFLEDCGERKEMVRNGSAGTSSALETSAGSSEQHFLSLKLGKAMYYEDSCSEKGVATLCMMPPTRQNRAKRSKSTHKSTLTSRCQVEGCNIDLSSAKEYHRKHRVCESHSRSPNVIIAGLERRFCQQCSRFHGLSDFDEKKRSCRKRLSDHNARRRKSLPKVTNFNSGSPSSVDDPRQQMSLSLDMVPPTYQRPAANLAWEALCSSKYAQTCQRKPENAICKNGQLNPLGIEKPFMITIPHRTSSKLFATRGIAADDLNPGFNEYRVSSSMDVARDYNSALSLLSTDAWGLCESKNILPQNHKQPNQIKMSSTGIQTTIQSTSLPSDQWRDEHNSSASGFHIFPQQGDGGTDFHLFKSPLESGLYPDLLG